MALFKILKGSSSGLSSQAIREGYCYVTTDEGKMYIDISNSERICLNSGDATRAETADKADALSNARLINGVQFDGTSDIYYYGVCSTAASTAAKTVTLVSDSLFTLKTGVTLAIKFSKTNTAKNPTLNVNGTGAKPIYQYGTTAASTSTTSSWRAGAVVLLTYDGSGWIRHDWTDSNTVPSAYCSTAASTAAKTASCTGYTATAKTYLHLIITASNSVESALTLNVNSKGAKPIYINGNATSSSNCTLPAGSYLTYYDGTNYHIRTDGKIPGSIEKADAFTSAKIITLTGDVEGSGSSTGANGGWEIATTIKDDSHNHSTYVKKAGDTMTGDLIINGNNGTKGWVVRRNGADSEAVKLTVDDSNATFTYTNDERSNNFKFVLNNTDTESPVDGTPVPSVSTVTFTGSGNKSTVTADYFSGSGANLTNLNASKISTGTLGTAQGGTGKGTWTPYGIVYASDKSTLSQLGIGTANQVLTSQGSGKAPTWKTLSDIVDATYVNVTGDTMTGNLTAPKFIGDLQGNADTATHAEEADTATNALTAGEAAQWSTARDFYIRDADKTNTGVKTSVQGNENEYLYLPKNIQARLQGWDTRDTNSTPDTYLKNGKTTLSLEFKSISKINTPTGLTGTYAGLMTFTPWGDSSGGYPVQIAMAATGGLAWRGGTGAETWGAWSRILDSNNCKNVGSVSQPIYFNANGVPTPAGSYAGLLTALSWNNRTLTLEVGGTTKTAAIPTTLTGFNSITSKKYIITNSATDTNGLVIQRTNSDDESLRIYNDENYTNFVSTNETTSGLIKFTLNNTDKSNGGTGKNAFVVTMKGDANGSEVTATKFVGRLVGNADSASFATYATYARITPTNPTSGTWYYPTWTTNTNANTDYVLRGNNGFRYYALEGTASAAGAAIISVGNSTATGTAGNKAGRVRIYGSSSKYGDIYGSETANATFYLPNTSGTFVTHATRGTAVGSATKPVYIAASGRATVCDDTLGVNISGKAANADNATYAGSAGTANSATKDSAGNVISTTFVKKAGDTMSGNLNFSGEKATVFKIARKKADGGGWAYAPFRLTGNDDATFANIGVYGTADALSYIYIGASTEYNSADNVRISPKGVVTASKFVGDLSGNATSATTAGSAGSAEKDSAGNVISTTFVKKTGDTMSGLLTLNKGLTSAQMITLSGTTAANAQIHFERTNNPAYFTTGTGGSFAFIPNGQSTGTATADLIIRDSEVTPGTTNVTTLGTSSLKWKNVYATTFTGALKGNADTATKATDAGHADAADVATSAEYLKTSIAFTPAETALTQDNVYSLIGQYGRIKRGTWNYSGNGYIAKGSTTASQCPYGVIDLAGTTVIQAANNSTQYTQIYITPPTSNTTGAIKGEMLYYINNGSDYSPTWYRVLTDKNYSSFLTTNPNWKNIGSASQPIYFDDTGTPKAAHAYSTLLSNLSWNNRTLTVEVGETSKTAAIPTTLSGFHQISFSESSTSKYTFGPTNQAIVLNGINDSTTIAEAPGIGFHIGNKSWGSLKFVHDGSFRFYNNDGSAYMTIYAKDVNASGALNVTGNSSLTGTLGVTGNATLSGTLTVAKATTLSNALSVTGTTTLNSTLTVADTAVFKTPPVVRHKSSRYGYIYFQNNAGLQLGAIGHDIGNATTVQQSRFYFREWSANATNDTGRTEFYETYYLPASTDGLTANKDYSILTSKNIVTTAQGGTGNKSFTANRLVWTETATKMTAGYHYASSAKVGINVTSEPSSTFHVNGSSYLDGAVTMGGTLTIAHETSTNQKITTSTGALYIAPASTMYIASGSGSSIIFQPQGTEQARFNTSGQLQIKSTGAANATIIGPGTAGTFYFPNTGGTFVTHATRGTAVGSSTKPVYIAATGRATECGSSLAVNITGNAATADQADNATSAGYSETSGTANYAKKLTAINDSDKASSSDVQRRMWFSYSDNTTGRPAYDDKFTYQTSTGTLTVPTLSSKTVGNGSQYIAFPDGGEYRGSSGTTGYLRIALPITSYKSATMVKFKVSIFNYVQETSVDYLISGYTYTDGTWHQVSAVCLGKKGKTHSNHTVRFGYDTTRMYVYIGENNTKWEYPNVTISDVTIGHSGTFDQWRTGWNIAFVTTTATIDETVTNTFLAYNAHNADYATKAGSATSAGTATSAESATTATRISINGIADSTKYGTYGGIVQDSSTGPNASAWHNSIKILHNNAEGYYTQLAQQFTGAHGLWHRSCRAGTVSKWYHVLDSENFNSYAPKLDGTGATGKWNINISGNADTATTAVSAGHATTADTATKDSSGKVIKDTYVKKAGDTMSGDLNFPNTKGIVQAQGTGSNYTVPIKWNWADKSATVKYQPSIGHHSNGDTHGAMILLPYAIETAASGQTQINPWGANDGFYISKTRLRWNGNAHAVDKNPTLAWGTTSAVATIFGTQINVTMPANPNTDAKVKQGISTTGSWRSILSHYTSTAKGTEPAEVTNQVYYTGKAQIQPSTGSLYLAGNLSAGGTATITGNTTLSGTLSVAKKATLSNDLAVTGSTTLSGGLTVANTALFKGLVKIGESTQTKTPAAGIAIHDLRDVTPTPGMFGEKRANFYFDQVDGRWASILHMHGWTASGYASWELAGNSATDKNITTLKYRTGLDGSWTNWHKVLLADSSTGVLAQKLYFNADSLSENTTSSTGLDYVCGITAFANGGELQWKAINELKVGYATNAGTASTANTAINAGTATTASKLTTSTAGGTTTPVYFSSGVPHACTMITSGAWHGGLTYVGGDGVMEVGKYIDFHVNKTGTSDYDVRITAATTGLTISGTTSGSFKGNLNGNASTANIAVTAGQLTDINENDKASSSDTWRRLWFSYNNNTTGRPAYDDRFAIQTSTGTLKAPIFSGNLSGNATSANTATSATYLTGQGANVANTRTQAHTQAVVAGGWASNDAGYGSTYGTTLDVSGYSTWYHRLAFHTNGEIDYWQGINTNTLTKIGRLLTSANWTGIIDGRYVKKTGDSMSGTLSWGGNVSSLNLRTGHASYDGVISYQTRGNEAMLFTTKNAVTSFMFVNGEDTITNMADDRWTKITPGLQIKNNSVAIGKLIANDVTPSYKLEVAGTLRATGTSTLSGAVIANRGTATGTGAYGDAAVEIREYNFGGAQSDTWGYAPRLSFHWAGRVAAQIGLASNGNLYIQNNTAGGGSFSPIMTEALADGRYVNVSGDTMTGHLYANNGFTFTNMNWTAPGNITCVKNSNGSEFSFDMGAGTQWHVWSTPKSASILSCWADSMQIDANGLLVVTTGTSHGGIKMGNAYVTSIGNEVIYQNGSIRFGGDNWDWNNWAGLKYDHSSKVVSLGLADGSVFGANQAQSGGAFDLRGIDYIRMKGSNLIKTYDSWVRINEGSEFASGIYTGSSLIRSDSQLQVGSNGSAFLANSSGNIRLSGSINYYNGGNAKAMIKFKTGDSNGAGIIIGGGGFVVIGSGESAQAYVDSVSLSGGTEQTHITSDTAIYFHTNCQDITKKASTCYINTSGRLYGAAWNDYAEFRECTTTFEAGQVVCENGDDTLSLSTERLQPGACIVSDTFGFAIGETDIADCPIAVSGRVLAYPYEPRDSYKAGDPVCAGPNGTVSKMTREEVREYPDRMIGTVSAIPKYETWGQDDVPVNGRIWIKVV